LLRIKLVWALFGLNFCLSPAKKMSPHRIRHSAITTVLDLNNRNYRATQRFSRHAQVQTVLKYDDNRQRLQKQMSDSISELI
jgi:integrase/recombinase XerC